MKFEKETMQPLLAALDPDQCMNGPSGARKAVRQTTDTLVNDALRSNNLPELARWSARTMMTVAEALITFDKEPGTADFVEAASALVEVSRNAMDKGLQVQDWDQAVRGSVMLELTCRGIHAALGLPYEEIFLAEVMNEDLGPILGRRVPADREAAEKAMAAEDHLIGAAISIEPPIPPELGGLSEALALHTCGAGDAALEDGEVRDGREQAPTMRRVRVDTHS